MFGRHVAASMDRSSDRVLALHGDQFATSRQVLERQMGLEEGNRKLYELKREEGLLQLRMQLLKLRQETLNNMNTQAALVAGCAVGLLSSGEVQVMEETTLCVDLMTGNPYRFVEWVQHSFPLLQTVCRPTETLIGIAYIVAATLSVLFSLLTIFLSHYLVDKSTRVALAAKRDNGGKGTDTVRRMENLITAKMGLIERCFHRSLLCLVIAVVIMVLEIHFVSGAIAIGLTVLVNRMRLREQRSIREGLLKLHEAHGEKLLEADAALVDLGGIIDTELVLKLRDYCFRCFQRSSGPNRPSREQAGSASQAVPADGVGGATGML